MTLDDYPIFKAALEQAAVVHAKRVADHQASRPSRKPPEPFDVNRQINGVKDAFEVVSNAIADNQILNPRYLEIKDALNRAIRDAYEQVFHAPFLSIPHAERAPVLHDASDISYGPTLHTAAGVAKKVGVLLKKNPNEPLIRDYAKLMLEITPMALTINDLKDKIVKRKILSPQEREEANLKARYTPPPSSSSAVALVHAMLDKFVNDSYESLVKFLDDRNNGMVNGFLKAAKEVEEGTSARMNRHNKPYTVKSFTPYEYFSFQGRSDSYRAGLVSDAIVSVEAGSYYGPFTRRQDADEILRNKAVADADDIKQTYVAKTLKKLVSIIEAKGDDNFLSVVEVGGKMNMSYLSGKMRVSFKDGSAFTAMNSVVLVINNHGTMFNRFPLTFHDVVMADGSKLRTPSEALMNTVFVGKDA
jgi:hypothetical protein